MSEEAPLRIGAFICHCGKNIGGHLDIPAIEEYLKTLDDVAHIESQSYSCSQEGLDGIKKAIKEQNLNRVVVAACTPRTHELIFQEACEDVGLNKYLFTLVNIREHCAWTHRNDREKATQKAKELLKMGIARAALLESQEEEEISIKGETLVIGGGISGMTAALNLASQGFPVHLVEKSDRLGGMVNQLHNLWLYAEESPETIEQLIQRTTGHKNITIHMRSTLKRLKGQFGDFKAGIEDSEGKSTELVVGTIIVATGATDYIPEGLYGYNQYDNVITLAELELLEKRDAVPKLKDVAFIQCVGAQGQELPYCSRICCNATLKNALTLADRINADIQDGKTGDIGGPDIQTPISVSKVSSEVVEDLMDRRRMRRARTSEEGGEGERHIGVERANITIFNRSICTYGSRHKMYFEKAQEKRIKFVHFDLANIPRVSFNGKRLLVTYLDERIGTSRSKEFDMVVLATPLIKNPDANELARVLNIPLGDDGFFLEANQVTRPVDSPKEGVYLCGTCKAPADIRECCEQALSAASRAAIPMIKGSVKGLGIISHVDESKCIGCKTCEVVCPYDAIAVWDSKAHVNSFACQGCGTCASICPHMAISMSHFTDEQLFAEALAALQGVE